MYNAPNMCWLNELSALYALVSLLAANFVRVLDAVGVSQTASSTINSAYRVAAYLEPDNFDNYGYYRILRG